jgi:toxin FitB
LSYLLDTNVISELVCARPNRSVVDWIDALPSEALFLSVLTLGEIRKGVEKLTAGPRRDKLVVWLEHDLPGWFSQRILPIDTTVAENWGKLTAQAGRSVPAIDSLLAATALTHGLILVTRNVGDFVFANVTVFDPWGDT